MKIYLLALLAAFAFQSAGAEPQFKIKGTGQAPISGGGFVQEKPDVTLEVKIDDTVMLVTEAMRKATDARQRGIIEESDWPHVTATLKDASRIIDQSKRAYYTDNEPETALKHLKKAEGLLAQVQLWAE